MELSHWINRHADFTPDKPAIIFEGRDISYAEFDAWISRFARVFKHKFGIGRGDRIGFLGLNTPELLVSFFAAARLGAMFVPLNWRLAPPEHVYILQNAAVKLLIVDNDYRGHAEGIRDELPDCEFASIDFEGDGWASLEGMDAEGDDRNPHVDDQTPMLLVYTSGTTGRPKGAVLNQRAVLVNALNSVHAHEMTSTDYIVTTLPMFHVGGLNIQTTPALYCGATVSLHRRFDPAEALEAMINEKPNLFLSVPATLEAIIKQPGWEGADISHLRSVTTGSSIVPKPLIEAFHGRGVPIVQVYGCTETAPVSIYLRREEAFRKSGSTGKAGLHCEMRIIDGDGKDVGPNVSGEILVRGENNFFEYWGNAEATAESLRDGWFYTGDIGYADEEGFVVVNDRKKDMINSGSENIYPAELEAVIHEMKDIVEGTVVGRPDEKWGEVPVAVLVLEEGVALSAEAFLDRFNGVLARYKHPKDVYFVDQLPRNAMGKILKFEVRDMVAEGL